MISNPPPTQQKIRAFFEDTGNEPVMYHVLLACIDAKPESIRKNAWAMLQAGKLLEVSKDGKVLVKLNDDDT